MKEKTNLGKIIAFVNQKGGVGKSTLTTNVAAVLSESYKVLLLDTDQQGSSEDWGVSRTNKLEEKNRLRGFSKHYRGIKKAREVTIDLAEIAASYDFVIVDTPGRNELVSLGVIAAANMVIIPLSPGNFSFWSSEVTQDLIQRIAETRPDDFAPRLLLNMRDTRKKVSREAEKALKELDIPVMQTSIGYRNLYELSSEGLSVMELPAKTDSDRKAQSELKGLIKEIEETIGLKKAKTVKAKK